MSLRIGVAGLGYWGPNLARNFAGLPGCELAWCCDASEAARERWAASFPNTRFTAELDDLLSDDALDAVVLATPVPTHGALAERVLDAGKHCFVEKPLAQSVEEAERAVAAAERSGRVLIDARPTPEWSPVPLDAGCPALPAPPAPDRPA